MTQEEVLKLWEAGRLLGPLDRVVLAASRASADLQSAADWPLGARNRSLAQLHCEAFGGILRGYTRCRCGEHLEFEFDSHIVAASAAATQPSAPELVPVGRWLFRLPTSRDLAIAAEEFELLQNSRTPNNSGKGRVQLHSTDEHLPAGGPVRETLLGIHATEYSNSGTAVGEQAAAQRLLASCCCGSEPAADWTEEDMEIIGERLSQADPLAEILLHFDCPACSASFDESLDLGGFVWAEIENRAKRIFQDVHALASAYGWRESEILALSPARRCAYVEMVQS